MALVSVCGELDLDMLRGGGPQEHNLYNRVGQMMNSNFPSVGQNVRLFSLHNGQCYE